MQLSEKQKYILVANTSFQAVCFPRRVTDAMSDGADPDNDLEKIANILKVGESAEHLKREYSCLFAP